MFVPQYGYLKNVDQEKNFCALSNQSLESHWESEILGLSPFILCPRKVVDSFRNLQMYLEYK